MKIYIELNKRETDILQTLQINEMLHLKRDNLDIDFYCVENEDIQLRIRNYLRSMESFTLFTMSKSDLKANQPIELKPYSYDC